MPKTPLHDGVTATTSSMMPNVMHQQFSQSLAQTPEADHSSVSHNHYSKKVV